MTQYLKFKELHQQKKILVIGNVWNVQSAKVFEKLNFESIGTSSAAIAHTLGYNDGQEIPFTELLYIVDRINKSTTLPLTVDIEFGYADNAKQTAVYFLKMELTAEIMYKAIVNKDTSFEGVFYTAVKTTGVFCRPSCTARKPKLENVEFLNSTKACILKGYRPCKVCKPLEKLSQTPQKYQEIINELSQNPSLKFKDYDLKQRGIEPSQIRRWFLKNHGITFQAFQRMFRINSAFKKIQSGETVTHTAFDTGFESLSGFADSFKNIFGISPKNCKQQNIIDLKRIETPIGTMMACSTIEGICLLEFTDRKMLETELKSIAKLLNATIIQGHNNYFDELETQLDEYFTGKRQQFSVPLHTPGTAFQNKVWEELQKIPYGQTKSYKEQAMAINNPGSVRAVANANGMNRISILIPCHRVIGADGQLTGYGGGLWRKKYLLDLEDKNKNGR